MYLKFIFIALSFVTVFNSKAQPDSITLRKSVTQLNESLLNKDTTTLKTLITPTVTYGHSNGWIQNSKSLIADLYNGKLSYTHLDQRITEMAFENKTAWVRATADIAGIVEETAFAMKLNILQVWIMTEKKTWKLMARQSVKIL